MRAADTLLAKVVDAEGRVEYGGMDGEALQAAVSELQDVDLGALRGNGQYAFLLNAYNVSVLDAARRVLACPGEPMRSLRHPLRWLRFFLFTPVRVGGRSMNLFWLEHRHLRPHLRRDPRGHFALVCGGAGCPPLRGGVYHAESLDRELDAAARAFLRPGVGYVLDRDRNVLGLSRILRWYSGDFRAVGGVVEAVCRHAPANDAAWIRTRSPRIRWMKYDWGLNQSAGGGGA